MFEFALEIWSNLKQQNRSENILKSKLPKNPKRKLRARKTKAHERRCIGGRERSSKCNRAELYTYSREALVYNTYVYTCIALISYILFKIDGIHGADPCSYTCMPDDAVALCAVGPALHRSSPATGV